MRRKSSHIMLKRAHIIEVIDMDVSIKKHLSRANQDSSKDDDFTRKGFPPAEQVRMKRKGEKPGRKRRRRRRGRRKSWSGRQEHEQRMAFRKLVKNGWRRRGRRRWELRTKRRPRKHRSLSSVEWSSRTISKHGYCLESSVRCISLDRYQYR